MEERHITIIFADDVLKLCPGLPYRQLLKLVKNKKLVAAKWGNRLVFDKDVVLKWRDEQLGMAQQESVK